jgi:outer membrane protein assembly factor BamD (BamD/ComL family)
MWVSLLFLLLAPQLYEQAQKAFKSGDFDLARKRIEQFLIKHPDDKLVPDALLMAAKLRRKPEEASNYYERVVKEYPNSKAVPYALYRLAQYSCTKRDYVEAIKGFGKIASAYPQSEVGKQSKKEIAMIRAYCFIQLGSFSEKRNAYKLVFQMKEHNPMVIQKNGLHKVWIGTFLSPSEAQKFKRENSIEGFITRVK